MRTVFGLLALLALFGAASYWQGAWTRSQHERRESMREVPGNLAEREASWGRLVIGNPSGADPVQLPQHVAVENGGADSDLPFLFPPEQTDNSGESTPAESGGRVEAPNTPQVPGDFEYLVPEGRVLSKICEEFYGSGRDPIPARVAAHNGLASPDELRAGVLLKLPDWSVLFPGKQKP